RRFARDAARLHARMQRLDRLAVRHIEHDSADRRPRRRMQAQDMVMRARPAEIARELPACDRREPPHSLVERGRVLERADIDRDAADAAHAGTHWLTAARCRAPAWSWPTARAASSKTPPHPLASRRPWGRA